jgi:hypothetical protein
VNLLNNLKGKPAVNNFDHGTFKRISIKSKKAFRYSEWAPTTAVGLVGNAHAT